MVKLAIDAGHGGNNSTPGKRSPDGEYEWNFNNKVLLSFISEIKKYEKLELLRVDDSTGRTDIPLKKRTTAANHWKADIYISFHHNANTGFWGTWTGTETYVHLNSNARSRFIAQEIQKTLVKAYNLKDRGVKTENFYVLRETNMPAILIEGGFMDSLIDIKKLRDDIVLKQVGVNVAQAIAKLENLTKKEEETVLNNESPISHTVKSGETLWSLSKQYEERVEDLMTWNNLSSNLIYAGEILTVKNGNIQRSKKTGSSILHSNSKYTLPLKVLRSGDSGEEVKQLQIALNAANFKLRGNIDGSFGQDTLQALKRFQSVYTPKEVDGIFGPKTRAALDKVINS